MAKRQGNKEAIELLADVLESALEDDLKVERRTWQTLIRLPKLTIKKALKRLRIPESRVGRCTLGLLRDGEEQIAAVWVLDKRGEAELLLVGDQEGIIGSARPFR
jgi:hypothetical protein